MKKNVKDYKPNTNNKINSKSKGSNSMKKNRRITAILTAACLTIPLACTAVVPFGTVAANNNQITINSIDGITSAPAAYQVFTGSYADNVLGVTGWGNGINASAFITALKASTKFGTDNPFDVIDYDDASPEISAVAVADIIGGFSNNSDMAKEVAKIAVRNVNSSSSGSVNGNVISGLDDGYYVIKDTATSTKDDNLSNYLTESLGMLAVAGGTPLTVTPKIGLPTVKKEVQENNSAKDWGKVADYNCGDEVPFRITVTLPDNIEMYEHYYLKVCDTIGSNYVKPTASDFSITIGGTQVSIDNEKCHFSTLVNQLYFSFEDIKALKTNVTKDDTIVIEYEAILTGNATALNDTDNRNEAEISYLNDPNYAYTPNLTDNNPDELDSDYRGSSPVSLVKVHTYTLGIHKVDGEDNDIGLEGAKFKIKNSEGKWAQKNTATTVGAAPILWVEGDNNATEFETNNDGDITDLMGIDAGEYTIVETKAPDGYNIAADTLLTIIPTYTGTELTELKYQIGTETPIANNFGEDENKIIVKIENNKGKTLPTTGGIGTKIFYIVGGMLVIGSGAALVIKKRIGKDEE